MRSQSANLELELVEVKKKQNELEEKNAGRSKTEKPAESDGQKEGAKVNEWYW